MNYIIKSPETEQEWEKYFAFRWKLLRKPWNMPLSSLKDSLENESFHLIALSINNEIVASGRLHFINTKEAQIRYMAVAENLRREGLGSKILFKLEEEARNYGVEKVILNSRNNAIEFYKSLNYSEKSSYHSDTGIPHTRMEKIFT